MAYSLSVKVMRIEHSIALMSFFYDRMRYLCPTVPALIESAVESRSFSDCTYLTDCYSHMRTGATFSQSWEQALLQCHDTLGREECEVLASLAPVLGATHLESQLSSIAYTRELLQVRLTAAREHTKTHTRLYRTLGMLAGVGIVILLG